MLSVKHIMVGKLNVLTVTHFFSCAPHLRRRITNFKTYQQCDYSFRETLEKVNQSGWISHYPEDSVVCFVNTYSVDSDLSGG